MSAIPKKYEDLIKGSVVAAAGMGVPGAFFPGVDLAAMSGIWTNMILEIAAKAGKPMNGDKAAKFVAAIVSGAAGYIGGSLLFTKLLHFIPGIGTGSVIGINVLLNGIYTYRLGKALVSEFEKPTFDGEDILNVAMLIIPLIIPAPAPGEAVDTVSLIMS